MRETVAPFGRPKIRGFRSIVLVCAVVSWISPLASASKAQDNLGAGRRFDLRIENGKLTDSRKAIRVARGDSVVLRWSADMPTVVHLHGYDIETAVQPDTFAEMSFVATATGRFPIETHGSKDAIVGGRHTVLIYFEVHPR